MVVDNRLILADHFTTSTFTDHILPHNTHTDRLYDHLPVKSPAAVCITLS